MADSPDTVSNIPDPTAGQAGQNSDQSVGQQAQQAANQVSPQQPQAGGSGPTGLPAASAPQTPAPQQQQQQQQQQPQQGQPPKKQSVFNKVLEMATGGPVRYDERVKDANGNYTGETKPVVQHRSSKVLAAAILANAVQGFIAGAGQQDFASANRAGAAVGAANAQKPSQQAQQRDDVAYSNQINTTKHNLEVHKLMLDLNKQQTDQMQNVVDDNKPILDSLEMAQKESPKPLILKQNITEDELTKLLSDGTAHVTRQSVFPDGTSDVYDQSGKQVFNPDGTPKKTYTYTVYDPSAMVGLTDELKRTNPELVNVASGQQVPVRVLANLWQKRGQSIAAQGYIDDFQKRLQTMTGDKQAPINFVEATKKDPILNGMKPILGKYAGMDPDKALDAMRKDKVDPNVIGSFQRLFNINEGDLTESRAEMERQTRKDQDIQQKKLESNLTLEREKKLVDYKKKAGVDVDDSDTLSNAKSFPNEWVDPKTGMHYNLSNPVYNVVEGGEDPSQMSKRATKGSSEYNRLLRQANDYSFARYGRPFDVAQASTDYKYANQKTTQDTIKLLRSLTGDDNKNIGGTFKQLDDRFNALGNTQIPKVNNVFQWLETNAGQPGVPAFNATLLGVADEYGKILGGGVATDSSRNEAKEIINRAFSEQQGKAALQAIRGTLANRQNAMVGDNRYLVKQFGKMSQPPVVPQGKIGVYKNGQLIGFSDDTKGTNYHAF
jgi:hypothetical protein